MYSIREQATLKRSSDGEWGNTGNTTGELVGWVRTEASNETLL